jgi:hypothetical protein
MTSEPILGCGLVTEASLPRKGKPMTTITITGRHSGTSLPHDGIISFIRGKWAEYRLMRSIESVPYDVMKDVGFPAAEHANEKH